MKRALGIALLIAGCIGAAAAMAQDAPPPETPTPPDPVRAMLGNWEFSNADRDRICRFVFRNDTAPGGYKLDIDKNCPSLFPSTRDVLAWSVDAYGNLRLLDSHGNAAIELTEVESGLYDGFQPEEGRYILQIATAATVQVRSASEIAGDWAIARGAGTPICALTLATDPAGPDAFALKLKPGCDTLVARFNPNTWRLDKGDLVLSSARGQSWRFEENDAKTWQRVPETADPIMLVRQ